MPGSPTRYISASLCGVAAFGLLAATVFDRPCNRRQGAQAPVAAGDELAREGLAIDGLWSRYDGLSEGDPVRFWYFHGTDANGEGQGLYRYGRVGYSNTNSFDYRLRGDTLDLHFRKSGERFESKVVIDDAQPRRELRFDLDPRDPGATYHWARGPISGAEATGQSASASALAPFAEHMWIDFQSYATGGTGFAMYQFGPSALDGRGVGWFHEGDFDDWRTEALSYRVDGDKVELFFDLNEELGTTQFRVETQGETRRLVLSDDPRDFWLKHSYTDAGRAFAEPAMVPMARFAALEGAR